MKHIPQYLQDALDAEISNAIAKQQETDFAMFENLVTIVRTYRINGKFPTRSQLIKVIDRGFAQLKQNHIAQQTPKRVIIARMQ